MTEEEKIEVQEKVKGMSNIERSAFLEWFAMHFCTHCGRDELPCYCWNDE